MGFITHDLGFFESAFISSPINASADYHLRFITPTEQEICILGISLLQYSYMQSIITEAESIAKKLVKEYQPEKIILFGSAARGDYRNNSDIDLLIIKHSNQKKAYRIKEVFKALRDIVRTHPLDPIVYTPEELEKRISLGDFFMKRILQEGKILYG